jgi:hypothetical protein
MRFSQTNPRESVICLSEIRRVKTTLKFIAAANPQTIMDLLAHIQSQAEAIRVMRRALANIKHRELNSYAGDIRLGIRQLAIKALAECERILEDHHGG